MCAQVSSLDPGPSLLLHLVSSDLPCQGHCPGLHLQPPASPPSPLCAAPPLPPAHCDDPGLGELLPSPRNLVTMILFSFEVDTLEIALKEMEDIVDVIFLVEATKSHKGVHDI